METATRDEMGTAETDIMETIEAALPRLSGTVRESMITDVITALPNTSVAEVVRMMTRNHLRHVVVVDRKQIALGVISQRDVLRHILSAENSPQPNSTMPAIRAPIESLLTGGTPVTILSEVSLMKAGVVLASNKIGCLPVSEATGELCGVLTVTDILAKFSPTKKIPTEADFKFFTPQAEARTRTPAYIRRVNGDLVIPRCCVNKNEVLPEYALLGYDKESECILVKFVEDGEEIDGAMEIHPDKDQLVITAGGFVSYFDLNGKSTAYDITSPGEDGSLLLSPRTATTDLTGELKSPHA